MRHSHSERFSGRFSRFFATSGALYFGIAVASLWILSWFGSSLLHSFLVEAVTLISFLTIFVFQRSQCKEMKAIQIKLDELIASSESASNRMIKAEEAPEHILDQVHAIYKDAAKAAVAEDARTGSINTSNADVLMEALHEDLIEAEELTEELADTMSTVKKGS
ncbi:MAG TPA: low affinity iron permease family protein [Planktothrix sp.]|jgi:low affinity Fe/Cu permease